MDTSRIVTAVSLALPLLLVVGVIWRLRRRRGNI